MLKAATVVFVCPVACKSTINELAHLMKMHSMKTWIVIMCCIMWPSYFKLLNWCLSIHPVFKSHFHSCISIMQDMIIWGSHSNIAENSSLLGYNIVSGHYFSTLQRVIVPWTSVAARPWRWRHQQSFKMLGTICPTTKYISNDMMRWQPSVGS